MGIIASTVKQYRVLYYFLAILCILPMSSGVWGDATITNFRVLAETDGQLIISVQYRVDSSHGDALCINAVPTNKSGHVIRHVTGFSYKSWPVKPGFRTSLSSGYAYLDTRLTGAETAVSNAITIYLYDCTSTSGFILPIRSSTFPYSKTWLHQSNKIDPEEFLATSNSGNSLYFTIQYDLQASSTSSVNIRPRLLKEGLLYAPHGSLLARDIPPGENDVVAALFWLDGDPFSTDGILLMMEERSLPLPMPTDKLAFAVVPRIKHWSEFSVDTDGDAISDQIETALGTNVNDADTDGDGLEDGWELEGYRVSGHQWWDSNLPFLGADPRRKDVFVEVDYQTDVPHNHRLPLDVILKAKELYAGLNITNIDGTPGVELHILNDQPIPDDNDVGGACGMVDRFLSYFTVRKQRIYHWAMSAHGTGGQSNQSSPSNHFVFGSDDGNSSGAYTDSGKFTAYSIFVHELGHNLGLDHVGSGNIQNNCQPNYPSLMNYAFDYSYNCSVYTIQDTQIKFSDGNMPALDENTLIERSNDLIWDEVIRSYQADRHSCRPIFSLSTRTTSMDIDWDGDGYYDLMPTQRDFHCSSGTGFQANLLDENDAETINNNIAASLQNPSNLATCTLSGNSNNRFVPEYDPISGDSLNHDIVCGIPIYDGINDHPWLNKNPVFALTPGELITHPDMRYILGQALDGDFRVRQDLPVVFPPDILPLVQTAPQEPLIPVELPQIDLEFDSDGDGYPDLDDNCPTVYNPMQIQTDHNTGGEHGDACVSPDVDTDGAIVKPGAIIESGVQLNKGVTVMPGAQINANAILNKGSTVGAYALIGENAVLNQGCTVGEIAIIGMNTILDRGVEVHVGAKVGDNSSVGKDSRIFENAVVGCFEASTPFEPDCVVAFGATLGRNVTVPMESVVADGAVIPKNTTVP